MSVRVNGKARSEDNIHTDDTVLEDTVISLNLSTEWAGTPHVVHLAFEGEISFKSITYKPTFASMEELNAKIMEWNSTFLGISPARTLVAREANPFPGPQNLVGPLIGGIIGLCTLVGVIILALYVHRRRNRLCQQSILDTILSDPNNSQELSVQGTWLISHYRESARADPDAQLLLIQSNRFHLVSCTTARSTALQHFNRLSIGVTSTPIQPARTGSRTMTRSHRTQLFLTLLLPLEPLLCRISSSLRFQSRITR